jgi:hypothetical protein
MTPVNDGAVKATTGRLFGSRHSVTAIGIPALLLGVIVGLWIGRITSRWKYSSCQRLSNADEVMAARTASLTSFDGNETIPLLTNKWEGFNPTWLNDALTRLWKLFQGNTKRLVKDVVQPILDASELPDHVTAVRVKSLETGMQSPLLREVRRMPSRVLSQVQYSMWTFPFEVSTFLFR